ncbi:MAG: Na+/H+ antiporter NhaC family protein [Bacillota bacterium]
MDLLLTLIASFAVLLLGVAKGIFIGYPLLLCYSFFVLLACKRGYPLAQVMKMSFYGGKKALLVLRIFVLIGAITASWMASGTVPAIVYYGIQLMHPQYFILYAFLISSFVSFLLGTCFGTISTVGIALMVIAKGGDININIAAGAIIAGSYFGDRCSPMSSSAHLVAHLTETDIYKNIKNMFLTAAVPFITAIVLYGVISFNQPLDLTQSSLSSEIIKIFHIHWTVLVPAIVILVLALLKVDIKISMLLSIVSAAFLSVYFQGNEIRTTLHTIFFGYSISAETSLQSIIKGGGVLSMLKPAMVVFVSCALAGIFDGTAMLSSVETLLRKKITKHNAFSYTALLSTASGILGCSQTIAIVLTNQLIHKAYKEIDIDNSQQAIDLENTAVVISPLIPWNIAALVPSTTLMVGMTDFIPYAFYLYLIPITQFIYLKMKERKMPEIQRTQ